MSRTPTTDFHIRLSELWGMALRQGIPEDKIEGAKKAAELEAMTSPAPLISLIERQIQLLMSRQAR